MKAPDEKFCRECFGHFALDVGEFCPTCAEKPYRRPQKLVVRQSTPPSPYKICRTCKSTEHNYTADHGETCDYGHTLVVYPPEKLTATEAVETQLLMADGGEKYTRLGGVYGYGHADRLLEWAREQDLVREEDGRAEVTERGREWLTEFGGSKKAWLSARSDLDRMTETERRANDEYASQFETDDRRE